MFPERRLTVHFSTTRIVLVALLYLAAAHEVRAEQFASARTDTIDWHRYLPLQVGNVWEYNVTEPTSTLRREILGDVSYQGRRYFILRESWGGATFIDPSIRYLRYDTAGVVVSVDELEADSIVVPIPFPIVAGSHEFLEYFDLRSAIGDTLHHDTAENEYYFVTGDVDKQVTIGRDTIEVEKEKCLHRSWWFECYAADIGFMGGGSLQAYRLSYAKIGSRTYGSEALSSAAENVPRRHDSAIELFPNPTNSRVNLSFNLHAAGNAELRIVDMTGREIVEVKLGFFSSGRQNSSTDLSLLPVGVYVVQLVSGDGTAASSFLTVIR